MTAVTQQHSILIEALGCDRDMAVPLLSGSPDFRFHPHARGLASSLVHHFLFLHLKFNFPTSGHLIA